jgi:hypothetical protein
MISVGSAEEDIIAAVTASDNEPILDLLPDVTSEDSISELVANQVNLHSISDTKASNSEE